MSCLVSNPVAGSILERRPLGCAVGLDVGRSMSVSRIQAMCRLKQTSTCWEKEIGEKKQDKSHREEAGSR